MTEDQISETLKRVTPTRPVPAGLLDSARRRASVTRRAVVGGGLAAAALAAGIPLTTRPRDNDIAVEAFQTGEVRGAVATLDLPYDSTPHVDKAAEVSQRLGWQVIQAHDGINRVVSPSSLAMSLVQAAEGARGESLVEVDRALGLTGDDRARAFGALRQALVQYDTLPKSVSVDDPPATPVVHQASNVVAIDAVVKQPFLDRLSEFYDATADQVTLEEAKPTLDAWVNKHTAGLIKESAYEPDPLIKVVLQDALLFAAAWRVPFTGTTHVPFRRSPGDELEVALMTGPRAAGFAEGPRWEAIRLLYDDALAADVILPALGVPALELTVDELEEVTRGLGESPEGGPEVEMPALDWTGMMDLDGALPDLELQDLGGIVDDGYKSGWKQKVRLQIDKLGTVGAAVTEMTVAASGAFPEPVKFTVDRPYVFRVIDTRTGWALFLAAIGDPTQEE